MAINVSYHQGVNYRDHIQALIAGLVRDFANGSQTVAAKKTGFPQRTIGRWVNGETTPSMEDFLIFCERLGIEPWKVFSPKSVKDQEEDAKSMLLKIRSDISGYFGS